MQLLKQTRKLEEKLNPFFVNAINEFEELERNCYADTLRMLFEVGAIKEPGPYVRQCADLHRFRFRELLSDQPPRDLGNAGDFFDEPDNLFSALSDDDLKGVVAATAFNMFQAVPAELRAPHGEARLFEYFATLPETQPASIEYTRAWVEKGIAFLRTVKE